MVIRLMHPEIDEKQMIGWQPVYAKQHERQQSNPPKILWGVCVAVMLAALGASGTLLWSKAQKSEAEIQQATYEAVLNERTRINECIQIPAEPNPKIQTTSLGGHSQRR
jgi:hypothetical protein